MNITPNQSQSYSNVPKQLLSIQQPKANITIEQPAAIIEMTKTPSKLMIDSSQVRSELGNIGAIESTEKYAQEGKKAVMQGITRKVSEGNQLMKNAGKGQGRATLHNIITERTTPKPAKIGLDFIPSIGSVKVNYTPSELEINVQPQKPKIDVQINKPIIDFTR